MYNSDTELIFPSRIIPILKDQRGNDWLNLVADVEKLDETDLDHLAFILMMARLDGCNTCSADSFRAMRGCTDCAVQNVRRYRGSDAELMKMYKKAQTDLENSKGRKFKR